MKNSPNQINNNRNNNNNSINVCWENKVILIADDIKINYLVIKAILDKTKARLLWVEDGEQAIEKCKIDETIDLVLMDYHMPKINGLEAIQKIKKFRKNLPIILQTTYAIDEQEYKYIISNCDDFISKPVSPKNLILKLQKYLD
ncbi:MAG: response regulator [Bacteroidales bacterium]|nr:response regulator [Bacteroidales bacterium]